MGQKSLGIQSVTQLDSLIFQSFNKVTHFDYRGSHSSNFYASSNRGRDDLDDNDYDTPNVGAKRQEVTQSSDTKKQRTLVRKLASKRPVTQKPFQQTYQQYTETPKPAPTQTPRSQQSTQNYNQPAFGSNKTPKSRGNINFNSYTNKPYQQSDYQRVTTTTAPTIYQRINNLTEIELDNSQEVVTPTYDVGRTYENSYNFRQQTSAFNKQKIPAPKANTYSSSTTQFQPAQTESSVRLPSTDYLRNIAQTYQQPAAVINNQLQDTSRNNFRQTYYTPYRTTQLPSTSTYPQTVNVYQQPAVATGYQTTSRVPQSSVNNQNVFYQSTVSPVGQSTLNPNIFYQSYSTPVAYTQPNTTTFDYNKYYQTSTSSAVQNTNYFLKQFDANKPNSQNPTQYYTSSSAYPNFEQSTTTPKYNPYTNFQKVNEKYDDEEFLKTAPSSNLKPSDLNAIYNQKKQLYINATLKAAYSIEGAHKSVSSSQTKPSYSPPKATTGGFYLVTSTQRPVSYQSTQRPVSYASTQGPVSYQSTIKSQVTPQHVHYTVSSQHTVSSQGGKFVPASPGVVVPTNGTKSQDYDYAYYDNGGVSAEYDQVGAVEEDFARIGKVHNTKS